MSREIIVIAHNLRSCHNVGSLLRTCEGIGVKKVFLTGYTPYPLVKNDKRLPHIADKLNKQIEKTALGAQNTQKWQFREDIYQVIKELSAEGYQICALEQSRGSIPINKFKLPNKTALLIGNEVSGLDEEILTACAQILEIPMYGKKESFNVIQAAAMALYAFRFSSD